MITLVILHHLRFVSGGVECKCVSDPSYGVMFANGEISNNPNYIAAGIKLGRPQDKIIDNHAFAGCKTLDWEGNLDKDSCVKKCCNDVGSWGYIWGKQKAKEC
jgi:hypothetical protein